MKIFHKAALVVLTAAMALNAHASMIDFDSNGTPGGANSLPAPISGFAFSQMENLDFSSAGPWNANSGPAHSGNFAAVNDGTLAEITLASGGKFNFQSLWLTTFSGLQYAVAIRGFSNGVEVGTIFGVADLGWTNYAQSMNGIDKLQIDVPAGTVMLDDLRVTAVPEPESVAMLLGGLAMLGWMARRRRS